MKTFLGSFTTPTSTGNFSVTGVGFTPKVVIFFSNLYRDSNSGDAWWSVFSFMTENGKQAVMQGYGAWFTDTGATTSLRRDACYFVRGETGGSGTTYNAASYVSMNSDGFTINFSTVYTSGLAVDFIALGGAEIENVSSIDEVKAIDNTGSFSLTGVGFQPSLILFFHSHFAEVNIQDSIMYNIGAACGSNQWAADWKYRFNYHSEQRTDRAIISMSADVPTVHASADFTSFDSDGWTVNNNTTNYTDYSYMGSLSMKINPSTNAKIGSFNQATSTGNQSITGLGFKPGLVVFFSQNAAATTSPVGTGIGMSVGGMQSSSKRFAQWNGGSDPGFGNDGYSADLQSSSKVLELLTHNYASSDYTLNARADAVSMDSDGFTINWDTVDATAREILYMAFKPDPPNTNIRPHETIRLYIR